MTRLAGNRLVPADKISRYLLDETHPDGGPKARFLKSFGFSTTHPELLRLAILSHPDNNRVIVSEMTSFGLKSVVECKVKSPDGRDPCIWTIWVEEPGTSVQRLVTAYPKR